MVLLRDSSKFHSFIYQFYLRKSILGAQCHKNLCLILIATGSSANQMPHTAIINNSLAKTIAAKNINVFPKNIVQL